MMAHITKIATVKMTTAIWEYDPSLDDNHILGGSLDVIATIHTLAVKVCWDHHVALPDFPFLKIQASGQQIECFEKFQMQCGLRQTLKIPLHSNV